jgi:hypothetical protein
MQVRDSMHSRAYIGQYSASGDFYIAAFQVSGKEGQKICYALFGVHALCQSALPSPKLLLSCVSCWIAESVGAGWPPVRRTCQALRQPLFLCSLVRSALWVDCCSITCKRR